MQRRWLITLAALVVLISFVKLATSQITTSGQTINGPLTVYGAAYINGAGLCVNPVGTTGGAAGGICLSGSAGTLSFGGALNLSSAGAIIATLGPGIEIGTPTGGVPAFGTLNAQGLQVNGVPVLTQASGQVNAQNVEIPTGQVSYTLSTLTVARTQLIWLSQTVGAKTTSIPGCTPAYDGWDLDVKDGAHTASTPGNNIAVQPLSGTVEYTLTAAITTSGNNLRLRCDGGQQNWFFR